MAREIERVRSVVLDIEIGNLTSIRVPERVGTARREPSRVEHDRPGVPRELTVFIVKL
jgi:RimJ/RimL family protein N-acetyltransferase